MSKLREKLDLLTQKSTLKTAGSSIQEELSKIGTQKIGYAIKDVLKDDMYSSTIIEYANSKNIVIGQELLADGMPGEIARLNFAIDFFINGDYAQFAFENLNNLYGISGSFNAEAKEVIDDYARKLDQIANVNDLNFQEEFETAYQRLQDGAM